MYPPGLVRGSMTSGARTGLILGLLLLAFVVQVGAANGLDERAFAPRSESTGATMFAELVPAQTGIVTENLYADPRMWTDRYQEFALGAFGTGVAIGDYDGDGRPDIFVVSKTESCRLFRNLGDWKFADVTEQAGLATSSGNWVKRVKGWVGLGASLGDTVEAWKQGATFADVNNDGRLDIHVCRFGAPNWLFINQGDGTFLEEAKARGLAVVDASGTAAFCDFDRDGWLDVYIQTNMLNSTVRPEGQPDRLFRNRGDGTFEDVTARAGIAGDSLTHSATWWDFDSDGWPDIYVAHDFGRPDVLYRNNRDGTFTDVIHSVAPVMPYSAMGADFGDVNNDGLIDFFVADMATTTHEKDQRGMASSRELSREDSDSPTAAPQVLRNTLYLNTGTGRLLEAANLARIEATDWTWSPRFEDLDNDGRLDLFVTNGMNREYQNADLRERIVVTENLAERMRVMRASPVLEEANLAYRNLGDLRFEPIGPAWGLDHTGVSFGTAFGDLDGDGDLDLIYSNYEAGVTVMRNDSPSGHRAIFALRGTTSNRFGVGATVRIESASGVQVRQLVLSRGYLSNSEPVLHFGLGDDARITRAVVSWPSGHVQTFEDLPGDRHFTITEPSGPADRIAAQPPPRVTQFTEVSAQMDLTLSAREGVTPGANQQALLPVRFSRRGPGLAVGDLNGDGRDDLLMGATSDDRARVLLRGAGSRFTAADASPLFGDLATDEGPVLVFDADGDGDNDVLLTRAGVGLPAGSSGYQPRLFLNDGTGALRAAPADALPPLPISVGAVAAVDFDRDGRLDLFIGGRVLPGQYPTAPRSALLANRGGRFEDVTDSLAPSLREAGMVTSALWSDVDADGWPDLLIGLEWGPVRYWRNDRGRGFMESTTVTGFATGGTGWWNSLASADFNGDGRMDYVAGNLGLNTPYRATEKEPATLVVGDFSGRGGGQLVEAFYEGGQLLPRRTRRALGAEIPSIRRRFAKNNDYASATLAEILGEERLASAQRFTATNFSSGVFLSQRGGTYRFEALPRIAQISPLQGVVAGDVDGDGHADIYAVQNAFHPIPAVGRFEGGLSQLLRGDGRGGFSPVVPRESGLVVSGDAKALVVLDFDEDGWPDFVVSRNNSTTLAFRNAGVTGRRSLRVVLRGTDGNASAIGARIRVEFTSGSPQLVDVQAGSGYYSQSSPVAFIGYMAENAPVRIRVRWPSGAQSEHTVPAQATTVTLTQAVP